jgi:hypothetical protein
MPLNSATTHTTPKRGTWAYVMISTRSRHIWLGTTGTAALAASMFFLQDEVHKQACWVSGGSGGGTARCRAYKVHRKGGAHIIDYAADEDKTPMRMRGQRPVWC